MKSVKLSMSNLCLFFAAAFPIMPVYFDIFGVSITNIICTAFLFGALLLGRIKIILKKGNAIVVILLIWLAVREFSLIYYGEYSDMFWTIVIFLFCGYIFVTSISTEQQFTKIIYGISYAAGFVGVCGIVEFLTGINFFNLLNTSGSTILYNELRLGLPRIVGFTFQTITYCTYLMIAESIVFYAITLSKATPSRSLKLKVIYILILLNAIFTLSRSSILCFLGLQLILAFKCGFIKLIKKITLITISVSIVVYIVSSFYEPLKSIVVNLGFMLLAVFDDRYQTYIYNIFGGSFNVEGDRIHLYSWVWETVKNNLWMGFGNSASFKYIHSLTNGLYTWAAAKESIEVQYLWLLYHYGLIGLVSECIVYVSLLIKSIKGKFKTASWENKLGFNFLCFATFFMVFLEYFAVNQSSERNILYVIVFLFLTYNRNKKYERKFVNEGMMVNV